MESQEEHNQTDNFYNARYAEGHLHKHTEITHSSKATYRVNKKDNLKMQFGGKPDNGLFLSCTEPFTNSVPGIC